MLILVLINSLIFSLLGVVHFYWLFGGEVLLDAVVPFEENGKAEFHPPRIATFLVAIGLFVFALVMIGHLGCYDAFIDRRYITYATGAITGIFALRAIGDFNYVGFFKKKRATKFAAYDSRYYAPLCLAIALIAGLILIL